MIEIEYSSVSFRLSAAVKSSDRPSHSCAFSVATRDSACCCERCTAASMPCRAMVSLEGGAGFGAGCFSRATVAATTGDAMAGLARGVPYALGSVGVGVA